LIFNFCTSAKKIFRSFQIKEMNISINTQLNFQSKANPIFPFVMKTKHGRLNIAEATQKDIRRDGFVDKLTKMFCKNFATSTNDPAWKVFLKHNTYNYGDDIKNFIKYYSSKVKSNDENMTLLLAKDKRNKIQGACLAYGYDRIPGAKDTTLYIDSIAINPAYRGFSVGRKMMEKVMESAKEKFTDVFLAGDKFVSGFYERMGFKPLDPKDEAQKSIIDYILKCRSDYPHYIDLYTKPLREHSDRWYSECAKELK